MKLLNNIIVRIIMIVITFIGLFIAAVFLTIAFAPQFGGAISKNQLETYSNSPNYKGGRFINKNGVDVAVKITFLGFIKNLPRLFRPSE